jgi:hypothetical protein
MDKWADYLISSVRSGPTPNRIDCVEVHSDFGCVVCENKVLSRAEVIADIKKGTRYVTIFKTPMGKWRRGETVHLVTVNGEEYLRIDENEEASDNFENTPEF